MLALVVGIALIGGHRAGPSPVAVDAAEPAPSQVARAEAPTTSPSLPPVPVLAGPILGGPVILAGEREEGTDGLMGRLPFGLAGDTPTVYWEREDRFAKEPLFTPSTLAELAAADHHKLGPIRVGPYPR
jgi:hypothetical protein